MNFKSPLCFVAIAAAMLSSLATTSNAQTPESVAACEAFTADVEARGDATIVSGIQAEETVVGGSNGGISNSIQVVAFDTPQLTLPSGTLTATGIANPDGSFRDTFLQDDVFTLEALADLTLLDSPTIPEFGDEVETVETLNIIDIDSLLVPNDLVLALEPNSDLGTAFGICIPNQFGSFPADDPTAVIGTIFDGDTVIGEITAVDDFSFIAAPGQTITRVEFISIQPTDILVAFGPNPELPSEDVSNQECLANIAAEIGALADAATDSSDAYALNVACAALNFAAKDEFYEEDGNRLSRFGCNVFTGAAYAICYLEHTGLEGTEEIVDRIVDKLEQIVDDEIDYAIANGGRPNFIERAEDLAEVADWIDEDLDNPFVASIAYKLAWANAYFATY